MSVQLVYLHVLSEKFVSTHQEVMSVNVKRVTFETDHSVQVLDLLQDQILLQTLKSLK